MRHHAYHLRDVQLIFAHIRISPRDVAIRHIAPDLLFDSVSQLYAAHINICRPACSIIRRRDRGWTLSAGPLRERITSRYDTLTIRERSVTDGNVERIPWMNSYRHRAKVDIDFGQDQRTRKHLSSHRWRREFQLEVQRNVSFREAPLFLFFSSIFFFFFFHHERKGVFTFALICGMISRTGRSLSIAWDNRVPLREASRRSSGELSLRCILRERTV